MERLSEDEKTAGDNATELRVGRDDGTFFMTFEDFVEQFNILSLRTLYQTSGCKKNI